MAAERRPRNNATTTPPPATTPQARENQLVALAVDLAEKQLRDGTASAMVTTHFLKLATEKERLEREKLENETKLSLAKIKQMENEVTATQRYEAALRAMKKYTGQEDEENEDL